MSTPITGVPEALVPLHARCAAHVATIVGDAAHDDGHVARVVRQALRLAAAEGARLDVVLPAAWLHDCVVVPKDSPDRRRASRLAADEAVRLLAAWGWDTLPLGEIAHAIEAHSFSAGIEPRTLEACVVQDADRLDAIGAIGLARCLALGGAMGRPLMHPDDPFAEAREPDDRTWSLDHLPVKLLRLEGLMRTAAGRAEAAARTAWLRGFLAQLRGEVV